MKLKTKMIMSKIYLKSQEQNINYLNSGEVASGFMLRPVQYSRIEDKDLAEYCVKNSYVPKAYVTSAVVAVEEAIENFLLNGHSISLGNIGTFFLSCESSVAPTAAEAGLKQFKNLRINFKPSVSLREKLKNTEIELDGVYRCLDLKADNKVYEKIAASADFATEDEGNDDNTNNNGGGNSNPGEDFVG